MTPRSPREYGVQPDFQFRAYPIIGGHWRFINIRGSLT